MCFDHDSRPPIAPIAGGALDGALQTISALDGNRFAAFRARPSTPSGTGVLILPDVRGLHPYYEELALRFAERGVDALALDWFGRTAGIGRRDAEFEFMPHVQATTWNGIATDIQAAVRALRSDGPERVVVMGFCMGGRMAFLSATLGLGLSGVIGFYGTLVGPWRNDAPEPVALAERMEGPVLGLFGGADQAIPAEHVTTFEAALAGAGVEHRLVTYPNAPHSFFDRKAADFAEESAAAWDEVMAFLGTTASA
jgi:carboxymethylenebutenolidase